MEPRRIRALSHEQFYLLVTHIKKMEAEFVETRPDNVKLSEQLTVALGFPVGPRSVADAKKTLGLAWGRDKAAPKKPVGNNKIADRKLIVVMAELILDLYSRLGISNPKLEHMRQLVDAYVNKKKAPE